MNAVKKIAMIIIMQNDLAAAVEFYKKLGFTLIFHVKDQWAELKLNNIQIGLCPTQEQVQYHRTGIVLEVENLDGFYTENKDTVNFLDKPTQAAHGIMTSIQDPSGNILDLYQPTPEKIAELKEKLQKGQLDDVCCKGDAPQVENDNSCCKTDEVSGGCC